MIAPRDAKAAPLARRARAAAQPARAVLAEPPLAEAAGVCNRGAHWQVHKFGGTCVATADRIAEAAKLICEDPADSKLMVVSAMGSHPSSPIKVQTFNGH